MSTDYVVPRTPAERSVVGVLEEVLGISPIGVEDDFFDLGGDSLMALQVAARVSEELGVDLPHQIMLDAPTAAGVAAFVETAGAGAGAERGASLVTLREGAAGRPPLFLLHPVGGSVYFYRELSRCLPAAQPVLGFQAAGLRDGAEPLGTVEELAERYLAELRGVQPAGPYALGGAAFGGLVALEMAQRLRAEGEAVRLLALFDTPGPGQMPPDRHGALTGAEAEALLAERMSAEGLTAVNDAYAHEILKVYRTNVRALHAYRPAPYQGRILYFLAQERREGIDPARPDLAWTELALGGLDTRVLPGDYGTVFGPRNAETVARVLAAELGLDGTPDGR
ncbi:thioesterase domain-containing protein [Kitasatospora sp. MMS16-BH015]|uniref:thioesterase domain-containing protein n=1 Tax=Kitasatospora sp. MMS16-BH015 TaxID=2018025 RepID=UPI00131A58EC|nr:thioesterase domain-containing protein [Kitasatospora sp. MMS16-BH015]